MSSISVACLVERTDGWWLHQAEKRERLCAVDEDVEPLSTLVAKKLVEKREGQRASGQSRLAVLLDASSILHATIDPAQIGGSRNHETLLYGLESGLPLSAEDLFADFRHGKRRYDEGKHKDALVALACERRRVMGLLSALEGRGLRVEMVTAGSLLLLQALLSQSKSNRDARAILNKDEFVLQIVRESSVELLHVRSESVMAWRSVHDRDAAQRDLSVLAMNGNVEDVPVITVRDATDNYRIAQGDAAPEDEEALDLDAVACRYAIRIVQGKESTWFDLLRDPNLQGMLQQRSRHPLANLLVLSAVCALVLSMGLFWRARVVSARVAVIQARQADLFRDTFPDKRMPSAILTRLRSELAKARGSRATSGRSVALPVGAVPAVAHLVRSLPTDVPFSMRELRVENGELYLDLELQGHSDAATIATALSTSGIEIAPPTTDASGDRVRALFRGTVSRAEGAGQ